MANNANKQANPAEKGTYDDCQNAGAKILSLPFTTAKATMAPPCFGNISITLGGRYSGPTSNAAYSVPRWVEFFQVASGYIIVNGCSMKGWIYHAPLRAYKTICCPWRALMTRPSIAETL